MNSSYKQLNNTKRFRDLEIYKRTTVLFAELFNLKLLEGMENSTLESQKLAKACPYCEGVDFIKKGERQKKYENVQIYYCNRCHKKFTPGVDKHRTFPLIILNFILCTWCIRSGKRQNAGPKNVTAARFL